MALSKTVQLQNSFGDLSTFQDAYIRVDGVEVARDISNAIVNTYKTKNDVVVSSRIYGFTADSSGASHIKQAYLHLKTLPEFADAVDC